MHVLRNAHAPENDRGFAAGVSARHFAQRFGRDAAQRRHRLGREALGIFLQRLVVVGAVLDEVFVHQAFVDDGVDHRVQHRHVHIRLELQIAPGMTRDIVLARIGHDQLGAGACRVLDPGGGHRMVRGRVGADQENDFGLGHVRYLVGHRTGAHAFKQGHHTGGMAETRAMVDVIGAEAHAHQFLEQIGFFIAALGGTETRQRILAVGVSNLCQRQAGQIERLFPARFAEHIAPVFRVHIEVGGFGHTGLADQRLGEALFVMRVIETIAALHAQTLMVRGTIAPVDADDLVVLDVIGQLATDAAVRAHRIDFFVSLDLICLFGGSQRAGRAGLHAFAAGHAGGCAHRVVLVEHDLGMRAAERIADHIIGLLFAAGAHAARALDAGIEIDRHRRM